MEPGAGLVGNGVQVGACLYGPHDAIGAWLNDAIGAELGGGDTQIAIGAVNRGEVRGAIGFANHRPENFDICLQAAFLPGCPIRDCVIQAHRYAFEQLECRRITVATVGKNKQAQRFISWWGYVREGTLKNAWRGEDDLILYRMTPRLWKRRGMDDGRGYRARKVVYRIADGRIEVF